jgi:hypothetical protein
MRPGSSTVPSYGLQHWTKTRRSCTAYPAEVASEIRPRSGDDDRWQRFAALPTATRRTLLACTAWLIAGYAGVALVASGVDVLLAPDRALPGGLAMILGGAGLALYGLVRARTSILRFRSDSQP